MNTQDNPPQPLTVVELTVDSYKRMKAAHVEPSPTGLVPVRGRNGQGKSSLIESMMSALGGKAVGGKKGKPALPITEGSHGAEVVVDLGSIKVTRTWTRDSAGKAKDKLVVTENGKKKSGPQGVLDDLVGHFADPVMFLGMDAAEQVKVTLGVLGLAEDLQDLEETEAGHYEDRRDANRDVDRLGKAVEEIDIEISMLPEPPSEPKTGEELAAELAEAKDFNARLWELIGIRTGSETRGREAKERLAVLEAEVAKLKTQIQEQRDAWLKADEEIGTASEKDTSGIEARIAALDEAARHEGRRELQQSLKEQHAEAKEVWQKAEDGVQETRKQISKLLGETQFPIDGMKYDHESKSLTINGIPFSQASQAERLKVAAAVAMSGNPRIKVLFAREGSLLDEESQLQLANIAKAEGWQLWLEIVDSDAEGAGIYIEDGEIIEPESAQ